MSEIADWLKTYHLEKYAEQFEANAIGCDILHMLTDADLKELSIPLGDRKRILEVCAMTSAASPSRRQLTVVILDLVDSTPMSESADPEEFRYSLQTFRTTCKSAIEKYNGYIYQYRGDAVIAYFGYPVGQEKSAIRAAFAVREINQELTRANELSDSKYPLRCRTGIATGEVVVGAEFEQDFLQENAVGLAPNLAARLQSLAKPGEIILCPVTRELTLASFKSNKLGDKQLKGIEGKVAAYKLGEPVDTLLLYQIPRNSRLTPFVGREQELASIYQTWNASKNHQCILVKGEAGVGKTRLIYECTQLDKMASAARINLQCSQLHQNSALFPVISYLQHVLKLDGSGDGSRASSKLGRFLRENDCDTSEVHGALASLLGIDMDGNPVNSMQPQDRRRSYFTAIEQLLESEQRKGDLLIIVEDIQWIDPTTYQLLRQITGSETALFRTMIVTARPEFELDAELAPGCSVVELAPLSSELSESMVKSVFTGEPVEQSVIKEIVDVSDGIPLFIEETTKAVIHGGENKVLGSAGKSGSAIRVAPTLKESLIARLDGLGASRKTALAASVIGREFGRDLLQRILDTQTSDLQEDLNKLVVNGALRVQHSVNGPVYQFKHALFQSSAYDSLLHHTRIELHSKIADALLSNAQSELASAPETLAFHLERSDRFFEAAKYYKEAGALASWRGSLQETVANYKSALRLLDALDEDEKIAREKVAVLSGLAATLLATTSYRSPEVRETANRAIAVCKEYGLNLEIAPFLYDIWIGTQGDGDHASALELARDFLDIANNQQDPEACMVANRAFAWSEFNLGRPAKAVSFLKESRRIYDENVSRDLVLIYGTDQIVGVGCGEVQVEWCLGNTAAAANTARRTIQGAEESGHVVSRFLAYQYAGCLYSSLCRDWKNVRHYANELIKLGQENEFPQAKLAGMLYEYAIQQREEDAPEAYKQGVAIIEKTRELGYLYMMPYWYTVLADACLDSREFEGAAQCLKEAGNIISTTNEIWHWPENLRLQALLELRSQGDGNKAMAYYQEAIEAAQHQQAASWELRSLCSLAEWQKKAHGESEALVQLAACLQGVDSSQDSVDLVRARALTA